MKGQLQIIGRAALSLVATLAIGGGVTYALFTSNPVTVSSNTVSTGSANVRVCDGTNPGGQWQDSVSTTMSYTINPGDDDVNVMGTNHLYLANDDGTLATAPLPVANCGSYGSGITTGTSTISMQMVPSVSNVTCTAADSNFGSTLQVRFGNGTQWSSYRSLSSWASNTTDYVPLYAHGTTNELIIQAKLSSTYTTQGASCTFDSHFTGKQQ